jgi:hypothetical protein
MGKKPIFRAVPVTNEEHQNMHRLGDSFYAEPEWWDAQVEKYLKQWQAESRGLRDA